MDFSSTGRLPPTCRIRLLPLTAARQAYQVVSLFREDRIWLSCLDQATRSCLMLQCQRRPWAFLVNVVIDGSTQHFGRHEAGASVGRHLVGNMNVLQAGIVVRVAHRAPATISISSSLSASAASMRCDMDGPTLPGPPSPGTSGCVFPASSSSSRSSSLLDQLY